MATISGGTLPPQTAKISGADITLPARIDMGDRKPKLLMATDQTEEAVFGPWVVPLNYVGTPVLDIHYAMASATTGDVELEVKVMAASDGDDVDADGWDTLNEVAGTIVPGTAGFRDTIPVSLTNNDSMAVGDTVWFHVQRDHDGDDAAAGDLEFVSAEIKYNDA